MQVLKDEVREQIVQAAQRKFAGQRFVDTTIADIAEEAGVSVGNIYRYFKNKTELFLAAVPTNVAEALEELLLTNLRPKEKSISSYVQRTASFSRSAIPHRLPSSYPVSASGALFPERTDEAEGFHAFLWRHRWETIILLKHDEGTPYEGLCERIVAKLAGDSRDKKNPGQRIQNVLVPILVANLLSGVVAILTTGGCENSQTALPALIRFYRDGLEMNI